MALEGIVVRWNEESGFGFIETVGKEDIFVHRTALLGASRLAVDDLVVYDTTWDAQKNKHMAIRVQILEYAIRDHAGKRFLDPAVASSGVPTASSTPLTLPIAPAQAAAPPSLGLPPLANPVQYAAQQAAVAAYLETMATLQGAQQPMMQDPYYGMQMPPQYPQMQHMAQYPQMPMEDNMYALGFNGQCPVQLPPGLFDAPMDAPMQPLCSNTLHPPVADCLGNVPEDAQSQVSTIASPGINGRGSYVSRFDQSSVIQ